MARPSYLVTDRCTSDTVPGALLPAAGDKLHTACEAVPPTNPTAAFDISVRGMPYLPWWIDRFGQYPSDTIPDTEGSTAATGSLLAALLGAFLLGVGGAIAGLAWASRLQTISLSGDFAASLPQVGSKRGYTPVPSANAAVEIVSLAPQTHQSRHLPQSYQTTV